MRRLNDNGNGKKLKIDKESTITSKCINTNVNKIENVLKGKIGVKKEKKSLRRANIM